MKLVIYKISTLNKDPGGAIALSPPLYTSLWRSHGLWYVTSVAGTNKKSSAYIEFWPEEIVDLIDKLNQYLQPPLNETKKHFNVTTATSPLSYKNVPSNKLDSTFDLGKRYPLSESKQSVATMFCRYSCVITFASCFNGFYLRKIGLQ